MDIDLLSKMVKELILDEDRVTLPGLGSFVAEIVPASFSDKGYTINPPYRRLFFRSRPDEGDELVDFYASSNKVEKEVAEKIIKDFLSELKDVLHEKKTVVFPGLGRLRATKENNLFFVADEDLDIYPDGLGLEPISLKTHQETPAQVAAAVVDLKSIITEPLPPVSPEAEVQQVPEVRPESKLQPEVVPQPEVLPELVSVHQEVVSDSVQSVAEPAPVIEIIKVAPVESAAVEMTAEEEQTSEPLSVEEPIVHQQEAVESTPEPEHEQEPELEQEPEPVVMTEPEPKEKRKKLPEVVPAGTPQLRKEEPKSAASRIFKAVLWTVAAAVVLIIAFTAVARLNPGIMDSILYTPEELEIVKTL